MATSLLFANLGKAVSSAVGTVAKQQSLGVPTPSVTTKTTVNQSAVFGPINVTPLNVSASASLFGGGGGSTGGVNISQISQPTSNISTQVSNVFTTTNTKNVNISNQYSSNVSNVLGSPESSPTVGGTQAFVPTSNVTPSVTTSQTSEQVATPSTSVSQTAGALGGMSWWQWLIIGGVAIVGIWMLKDVFKSNKKSVARYAIAKGA